jgi:hypothetical protein
MALVERICSSWTVTGLVIGGMVEVKRERREGREVEAEVCGALEAGCAYRDISYHCTRMQRATSYIKAA